MAEWKERFNEALAAMLREEYDLDAVKVVSFEDTEQSGGYCETCYYEYIECVIKYENSKGETEEYRYYGSFAELVGSL
ncbi:hypothetical protein HWB76_gp165 [Streptomyces phage Blueeyedbeauty]|uniref:Uncharacterized protein n=1 Tax=Streptomyces phage Blueeyedbeauty TaxID=2250336 RepID=A0A345L1T5_9CAUD|nr:hypothetical protein HWB76_gp165 [Streptomyces phage Blueeyedbeauty]AXH49237.1 hypothetical protein SEA_BLUEEYEDBEAUTY_102 [Streptomyces phage Blueeyedbeauty]